MNRYHGKPMVQRVARHGKHSGEHFPGCSGFPKCRYTEKEKFSKEVDEASIIWKLGIPRLGQVNKILKT
ncbi:hypothetical protein EWH91_00005 [Sporolactobacillus sp. THM19-2]|jgi:ssDNA-binding Zn-finger/Zn-ribbon topoisomerase 1|nr:hypothetical protein EWH91_00005 [Sporolactobacillus sp. THM19-2]